MRGKHNKVIKYCKFCTNPYECWPSQHRGGFCSRKCAATGRRGHPVARFLEKIEIQSNGCWEWMGYRNSLGYGELSQDNNKKLRAHRAMMELIHGTLAVKGKAVLHTCDNPPCVNPDHLEIGTQTLNMVDMWSKNRGQKAEKHYKYKITPELRTQIKQFRLDGLKNTEISELLGLSLAAISAIINDKYPIRETINYEPT